MELNAATDYLGTNELLCDITAEQPVEGEFTIPDYQPEIFKIVKAKAEPVVVQKLAVGSRATVDGYVRLTVIYQSKEDKRLIASTQKLPFSKQTDLKEAVGDSSIVLCDISMSYLNCRAVNQRRIDVRGAANIAIKVLSGAEKELVSDVSGEGTHQRQRAVEFVKQAGMTEKQFTLDEELAIDFGGNATPAILRCDAKAYTETVLAEGGRVTVSGAVNVAVALDISNEDEYRVKRASFSLPYNQIVDIEETEETHIPEANISVLSVGAEVEEDGVLGLSVLCALEVRTYKSGSAILVSDVFSTKYELDIAQDTVALTGGVTAVREPFAVSRPVEKPVVGAKLIDYFITPVGTEYVSDGEEVFAEVSAVFSYFLSDAAGDIVCWDYPFTFLANIETPAGIAYKALDVLVSSVECSESDDTVTFKAEGCIHGTVTDVVRQAAVGTVSADTAKPKAPQDMALAIYYADKGEDIFEIAKAFGTSPVEIANENNVADGTLEQKSMLLIPIVE